MRSFLFVPADSDRKLAKGASSGADALILDLEDSVALSNKENARKSATEYLKSADRNGPKLVVRINALDTPFWHADIKAVVPHKPDIIVIPKTISGDCVRKVGHAVDEVEHDAGGMPRTASALAASRPRRPPRFSRFRPIPDRIPASPS